MRAFGAFVFSADEMAALEGASYFEAAGAYAANLVELHRQAVGYRGPTADDPAVLATVSAPVLVLHGSDTKAFFTRGARLVAEHVPGARPLRIEGVGHAAPVTHAAALAAPLDEFFRSVQ
jgi:pimeloyl-ACP methyl ester carboxylesterase